MLSSGNIISGFDVATGTFALMLFSAGAAAVVLAILMRFVVRRAGQGGVASAFLIGGLALVGAMLVYTLLERSLGSDQAAERRAIEARAAELTARSLASGSALGCLDAVANMLVEDACEKPLFASPEAVAAAVAYVDARLSLLTASAALADRDPSYQPVVERLRRGLEADRYGVVAHVLMTRGCNGADCAELRLLRDPARVVANMKSRVFEASIGAHAVAWSANGSGAATTAATAPAPMATTGTGLRTPGLSSVPSPAGAPGAAKLDFPSANSIPAVSIMNPEPGAPADAETRPTPIPKRPPAPRRQTAHEPTAAPAPPSAPPQRTPQPAPPQRTSQPAPPAPAAVAPEAVATPEPAVPDPHATR
jgi:hypothetical protein